jgi:3',5'-cyclic-nucleotide phosphodiesterase
LTDEFARQASMEQDLGIPTALFAAPVREVIELGKSQLGFMNMFAIPLFQGVTDVLPGMGYCVDELQRNKSAWEERIAQEQAKARHDSDDSAMMDGMFSPRAMSVANPSDASHQKISNATLSPDLDLRKALLSKSPFLPANGSLDEFFEPHHHSLPAISTTSEPRVESNNPSPSEVFPPNSDSLRSSTKPSQLQLSFATTSAPGLLDHPSQDPDLTNGEPHLNGISVNPSLVTDPVVVDPPTPSTEKVEDKEKQRSSDGTEGSVSATSGQDWTSQATSATTGKMPLSPSTQGTSIMSSSSAEKSAEGANNQTPTRRSPCSQSEDTTSGETEKLVEERDSKGIVVMERVKNLRKKPSRFRMNFWKRSKSASPPMPVSVGGTRAGVGSEEELGRG